jgi:hypothetical protein
MNFISQTWMPCAFSKSQSSWVNPSGSSLWNGSEVAGPARFTALIDAGFQVLIPALQMFAEVHSKVFENHFPKVARHYFRNSIST